MTTSSNEAPPVYSMSLCKRFSDNDAPHSAYGISYRSGGILTTLEDISCNGDMVSKMAEVFTICGLPYSRLWAAVEALLP